ncbi:TonB-dependent receptor plug domain-containing protein [Nibricoccus aquaticus]|uniref:TonB-dependent receptor plug domain-containing protein n=1 Tax=Nibricoccus aquaticus TaxID=2576891 RepID=UPI001586F877|nr:TonB-dependent receptor plug domain-containing protein [Nibricoccus aquaticus]
MSSTKDVGYLARETLAGSRLKTSLRDVSSQVSVMTPEFLQDVGAVTLDEALRYSLNVENPKEYYDATGANNTSLTLNPFSGQGRTRGLASSTTTHDFFPTYLPVDSYNTERFTFTSGPNAILFGSGNPAGSIDTAFKRARHGKTRVNLELRGDSEDGLRGSLDVNQPLIANVLSVRVAGVKSRGEEFRKPNFEKTERTYITATYEPLRWLSLRGWYEDVQIDRQPVRNTIVKDRVSSWIAAGRPIFNNALGYTPPANNNTPGSANYSPVFLPFTGTNATSRQVYVLGQGSFVTPAFWTNTVISRGYDTTLSGADGFDHSVNNSAVFPNDTNITGNGLQNRLSGFIRGGSAELNPFKNFYVELGFNEEAYKQCFVEFGDVGATALMVDANRYLPDGVTLNPNAGRYYIQGTVASGTAWNHNQNWRGTASYELDFTGEKGGARWLGRHRIAGLLARDRNWRILQRSTPSVVGGGAVPYYRVYVDRPDDANSGGVYHVNIPFDLFSGYTLPGTNTTLTSPFATNATFAAANGSAGDLQTQLYATQHFLLQDRLVLTYGKRNDEAIGATTRAGVPGSLVGRFDVFNRVSKKTLRTDLKGAVAHPFKWLSLHYNESNSQNPSSASTLDLDGSLKPTGDGTGKDYGFSLNLLNEQISLRVNRYESILLEGLSGYRAGAGIGGINPFRDTVFNIEKSVLNAGAPINAAYASYGNAVAANAPGTSFAGREVYDVSSNTQSEGYEVELVANPTRQWRLSTSFSETESVETDIASDWFAFINTRLPVWAAYANSPLHNDPSRTVANFINTNVISSWNFIRAQDGRSNPAIRKYRVNATTRYTVANGPLKNAFIGGSYIWRSKAVLGYATTTVPASQLEFSYPGLTTGDLQAIDTTRPYYSDALTAFDAFVGYSRTFLDGKLQWRVQLNVRNLLDDDDPLAQRVDSSGIVQVYNLVEPRTFVLTNSFSF